MKERNLAMLRVGGGLLAGITMFVLGQTEPAADLFPYSGALASGGAVGVLGWSVWYAYMKILPKQQETFTKTLDDMASRFERIQVDQGERHERWENARHMDSEKISDALQALAVNCAEARNGRPIQGVTAKPTV
jgi:hypothetical protein